MSLILSTFLDMKVSAGAAGSVGAAESRPPTLGSFERRPPWRARILFVGRREASIG